MTEKKLEWIYKGISGLVDREDYLTGRKIDKTFQLLEQEEKGQKGDLDIDLSIPSSIFKNETEEAVDLINKMREDPLYVMKKKQIEEGKKILQNPIKMKRIKAILETNLEVNEASKKKKKKKHQKIKRNSSSSDDNLISRKNNRERRSSPTSSNSSSERRRSRSKTRRGVTNHFINHDKEASSNNYQHSHKHHHSLPSTNFLYHFNHKPCKKSQSSSKHFSKEELEKRRQEMLEAGSWREKQRKMNVEHYKKEEEINKDGYFCGKIIKN